MKYISADYIKAIMKGDRLLQGNCEYELWKQEVDKKVDAMPSIEVMDVVTAYQQGWCDALDASINALNDAKFQLAKADRKTEPTISKMEQVEDEPTTQMKTQNSNLTFKTLEYCDICDHKGCEECIANALDEHCMPSQFKKQIEDECAKEYEELGLKELKELIEADRKTENSSEIPNNSNVSEKPTGSERSSK